MDLVTIEKENIGVIEFCFIITFSSDFLYICLLNVTFFPKGKDGWKQLGVYIRNAFVRATAHNAVFDYKQVVGFF